MSPSGPMHTALVASFCCTRMASPLVTAQLSRQDIEGQKGRVPGGQGVSREPCIMVIWVGMQH
jgi:hypothetical protein